MLINLDTPQSQTDVQLLSPSRPTLFFVTIYLEDSREICSEEKIPRKSECLLSLSSPNPVHLLLHRCVSLSWYFHQR